MTEINDLRERVEAAEQRFGLMDEQQRHYSERLIGLIETIEAQLAAARGEIEKQIAENSRLTQENEELRSMLHSVLRSIEEKTFTRTLQNLEARVSALVTTAGAAAEAAAPQAAPEIGPEAAEPEIDAMVDAENVAEPDDGTALIVEAEADAETAMPEESSTDEIEAAAAANDEAPAEASEEAAEAAEEMPAEGGLDETAEMDTPAEMPEAPENEAEEADDLIAAMTELNASDEAFAEAIAEGTAPGEPAAALEGMDDAQTDEAETDEAGFAEEAAPDAAAQAEIAGAEPAPTEAIVEEMVEEAVVEAVDSMAPTVKEIIRRVGDLARELERTEAARRTSLGAEEKAADNPATGNAADDPPLDQAASA